MKETKTLSGLLPADFHKTVDGKQVDLFVLTNKNGLEATVINFGGKVASLMVPDKNGKLVDVVLGKSNIEDYMNDQEPYFGAICGRTANRIAKGQFTLNGKQYQLAVNNGPNSLHGGLKAFNSVVWDAEQVDDQTLKLTYLSKDGEEGFPGNLEVTVIYHLSDNNSFDIEYKATTDQDTIINITNHSYFNLAGEGDPCIGDQLLQINADYFLGTTPDAVPYDEPIAVEGTPFDFRKLYPIGERINDDHIQLVNGNGYDHNFNINNGGKEVVFAAKAVSPKTGIEMEVYTSQPGVQLYTSNYLDGSFVGKNGHTYPKRSAFCLETQHYPDSINHPQFPSIILRKEDTFNSKTSFKFSAQ
ncbi:galactose mutarotase [Bacteroidales bacterium OttesenSCG-928-M11]|nr:galactose mutarotase [Bacteroidales bacterium OttesenSCG-928-M11]